MRWKSHHKFDDTWIIREDMQRLVPNLLEYKSQRNLVRRTGVLPTQRDLMGSQGHHIDFSSHLAPISFVDIVYFDFIGQLFSPRVIVVFGFRLS